MREEYPNPSSERTSGPDWLKRLRVGLHMAHWMLQQTFSPPQRASYEGHLAVPQEHVAPLGFDIGNMPELPGDDEACDQVLPTVPLYLSEAEAAREEMQKRLHLTEAAGLPQIFHSILDIEALDLLDE